MTVTIKYYYLDQLVASLSALTSAAPPIPRIGERVCLSGTFGSICGPIHDVVYLIDARTPSLQLVKVTLDSYKTRRT